MFSGNMRLPFNRYKNLMGGGRNWIILVFSLLLAFFMWSIMKLSGNYSSYVKYRLEVTSNIQGRSNIAVSDDPLVIGAKATGFKILQNNGNDGTILRIEGVDAKHLRKYGDDDKTFYLFPDDIRQAIQDALGADIKVESLATDTLFFQFPLQANKKVPVTASDFLVFDKQYMSFGPGVLKPDSVLIYGNIEDIDKIEHVITEAVKGKNINESITAVLNLNPINGVRFSTDQVLYTREVGRYVESSIKVPVTIENAPSYANVAIIPQEVIVRFRYKFGIQAEYTAADFAVTVHYDDILREDVVKARLSKKPEAVLEADFQPKFVECVL